MIYSCRLLTNDEHNENNTSTCSLLACDCSVTPARYAWKKSGIDAMGQELLWRNGRYQVKLNRWAPEEQSSD
jgi:hypothetical protein